MEKIELRIESLETENRRLTNIIKRYEEWIDDLQSGMYVNCVYCGHRYGPVNNTPVSMADILKAHIEECPEHPMSVLKVENKKLTEEISILNQKLNWRD